MIRTLNELFILGICSEMFLLDDVIDNNFLNHNVNEGSVVNFIVGGIYCYYYYLRSKALFRCKEAERRLKFLYQRAYASALYYYE